MYYMNVYYSMFHGMYAVLNSQEKKKTNCTNESKMFEHENMIGLGGVNHKRDIKLKV